MVAERRARKVGQFWERVKGSKFLINFFGRQFNPATDFFLDKYNLQFGQIPFSVWTNIFDNFGSSGRKSEEVKSQLSSGQTK